VAFTQEDLIVKNLNLEWHVRNITGKLGIPEISQHSLVEGGGVVSRWPVAKPSGCIVTSSEQ
jgi:hypothetical protein